MNLLFQLCCHVITLIVELLHKIFELISLLKHFVENLAKLADLFDIESFIGICKYLFNPVNELFGSLEPMEKIQTPSRHIVDGEADFLHNFIT